MGRPKTYNREQALQRAMKLFWKKGFEGSSLDEIVKTTGLNRFSLYKEFGGKMGLFKEALNRYMQEMMVIGSSLAKQPYGLHNIYEYFDGIVKAKFLHGCLILNTMTERHLVGKNIFKEIEDFMVNAENLFVKNLKTAKEQGDISANTDIEGLAKALMALDTGIIMYNILGISETDKKRIASFLDRLFR